MGAKKNEQKKWEEIKKATQPKRRKARRLTQEEREALRADLPESYIAVTKLTDKNGNTVGYRIIKNEFNSDQVGDLKTETLKEYMKKGLRVRNLTMSSNNALRFKLKAPDRNLENAGFIFHLESGYWDICNKFAWRPDKASAAKDVYTVNASKTTAIFSKTMLNIVNDCSGKVYNIQLMMTMRSNEVKFTVQLVEKNGRVVVSDSPNMNYPMWLSSNVEIASVSCKLFANRIANILEKAKNTTEIQEMYNDMTQPK